MELYPAIDIRGGRCVRLLRGDYDQETVYGDDPVAVAKGYEAAGAPWVHVVDLDAARSGQPENRDVVASVTAAIGVPVQSGGGVRDDSAAEALLAAGVQRVVIGTAALQDPPLVRRLATAWPGRIAVGIDGRAGLVAVRGWLEGASDSVLDVLPRFADAGVDAVVITDIAVDGTLAGPDVEGLAAALRHSELPVIASGGIGTLDHLRALAALDVDGRRLAGAICGKALYEGCFTVAAALDAVG